MPTDSRFTGWRPTHPHGPWARMDLAFQVTHTQVLKVNPHKAVGPDGVPPKVLKACGEQLAGCTLTSSTVPIPGCSPPDLQILHHHTGPQQTRHTLNAFRPVALTPVAMKYLEKRVLAHMDHTVPDHVHPSSLPPPLSGPRGSNRSTRRSAPPAAADRMPGRSTWTPVLPEQEAERPWCPNSLLLLDSGLPDRPRWSGLEDGGLPRSQSAQDPHRAAA